MVATQFKAFEFNMKIVKCGNEELSPNNAYITKIYQQASQEVQFDLGTVFTLSVRECYIETFGLKDFNGRNFHSRDIRISRSNLITKTDTPSVNLFNVEAISYGNIMARVPIKVVVCGQEEEILTVNASRKIQIVVGDQPTQLKLEDMFFKKDSDCEIANFEMNVTHPAIRIALLATDPARYLVIDAKEMYLVVFNVKASSGLKSASIDFSVSVCGQEQVIPNEAAPIILYQG